ncbi:uncharacterized protein LOC110032270 [Phalaenopsis equestris]|uniref:uncharacterized protein LOC110032270 n=1 Tax=Phalaenopsis equestris TaxID=78828 RepID=UPI0009E52997|nr:uncharacterized protein LOC110032270 [Phalaenopsis equestris]
MMLPVCKPCFLTSEITRVILRRTIKASLCTFLLFSLALVTYSLFSSAPSPWRFRSCHAPPITPINQLQPPTNLSHIAFGIGASARTWHQRRKYSDMWWRPDEMRGFVWLDKPPIKTDWSSASPPWKVSAAGMDRHGTRAAASRIARIATEMYALGMEGVRWFVMGDDDTVFFPENLVAVLGKYDHEQIYYIGAPSESVEQDEMHSYGMAFGGGGFAVSYAAAAALSGVIDGCLERYADLYGSDQRVQACFSELGVPLTREPGFHQVDLRGDIYGMLAAHPVAPLVSLHHLDYVQPISPLFPSQLDALRVLFTAARTDPARTLQQSFCYLTGLSSPASNWSLSVSWGYTVQLYPWIVPSSHLEVPFRTFKTWRSYMKGPFSFNTRELEPPALPCKRPLRFFLDQVVDESNGTVTEYKRFGWGDESTECDEPGFRAASRVRSVRVFATKMNPNVREKAPRRQCCDVRRKADGESIEMRIRECGNREATSPP